MVAKSDSIVLTVKGNRALVNSNVWFKYGLLWSDAETWNGENSPRENESIYVPPCETLIQDVISPNLFVVIVEGTFIVKDMPLALSSNIFIVNGGNLVIGTRDCPF